MAIKSIQSLDFSIITLDQLTGYNTNNSNDTISIVAIMENSKDCQEELNIQNETSPIARLIQLGRKQSFITTDDILREFPEPEKDIEALDQIFGALICAEIPYIEDDDDDFDV